MKKVLTNFSILILYFVFLGTAFAEDIVIDTNTGWTSGTYTYNNVLITNGATLTFDGAVTLNAQNLTIEPGSSISANGKGYAPASGLGAGKSSSSAGSGAGYGGKGGDNGGLLGGPTYGSAITPQDLGSGGGNAPWYGNVGGGGGGAIRLNITNTLTLNGTISANGNNGFKHSGGGSGGSIYVIANALSGSGMFTANGGSSTSSGGGGGRIAIYYQTSSFTGTAEAKGGSAARSGEDGTACFIDTQNNIFYPGPTFKFLSNDSPFSFNKVILNNAQVGFEANVILFAQELNLNQSTLTLTGNETLNVEDILLTNNSTITHYPQAKIYLNVVNLTIDPGSSISANGKGFAAGLGPGAGKSNQLVGSSAGYGGKGGDNGALLGGPSYGSALTPQDLGSGGGNAPWYGNAGGSGGGAIRLTITNTLNLNGTISANGDNGFNHSGGGSGGSIYVITNALTGSGLFMANGGSSGDSGGGGGRIAIYYQTLLFTGNAEAKGGTGYKAGEDGTVAIQALLTDAFLTVFNLSEKSSQTSEVNVTLVAQNINLNNVTVTGDLSGTLGFTNLEIIKVNSGPFSGKGFSKGECEATLEGVNYKGQWRGVTYFVPSENKIYLKGELSGEISGILQGYISESAPGNTTDYKFQATAKLNRLGTDSTSASINLEGMLSYQQPYEFPPQLYIYQAYLEGSCFGFYANPLSAVVTHLRLTSENEYKNEGFSIISYNSMLGQGQAFSYNRLNSAGSLEFSGLFEEPLLGKLSAVLDESKSPLVLSGTIESVHFGAIPEPDLRVKIIAPRRVSPGQKANYVIEYRNDGLKTSGEVVLFVALDYYLKYISGSSGAFYNDILNTIDWNLGNLPAKSRGYLSIQVEIAGGLPQGTIVETDAIINELVPHSDKKGIFLNGIGLYIMKDGGKQRDEGYAKTCGKFSEDRDLEWIPAYDTGSGSGDIGEVINAFNGVATEHNGLLNEKVTGGFEYETAWGYSGGTRTLVTAIEQGKLKTKELVLVSPVLIAPLELEALHSVYGVEKIVIYQSAKDKLHWAELYQLKIPKDDPLRNQPWIEVKDRDYSHTLWLQELTNEDNKNKENMSVSTPSAITTARDPNIKYGPEGDVLPGQKLNYKVEYENEGEGIAFFGLFY